MRMTIPGMRSDVLNDWFDFEFVSTVSMHSLAIHMAYNSSHRANNSDNMAAGIRRSVDNFEAFNTKTLMDSKFKEFQAMEENKHPVYVEPETETGVISLVAPGRHGHLHSEGNISHSAGMRVTRNIMGRSVYEIMETAVSLRRISDIFPNDDIIFFLIWCISLGIHAAIDMLLGYHTYLLFSGQTTLEHYANVEMMELYK